ncbi:MAG: acyl-ACP--UDP-N-acetylglucosamine O-acyltransferase [Gammaproteobacteria bacterium]
MSTTIHPSAIIEPGAEIGADCSIGPYCHVGANVRLGASNVLHSHVVVAGRTTLLEGNEIHPFACIGSVPEDKKFRKEFVTYTRIGRGNVFREYCTVNAGSLPEQATVIGNDSLFLSYSHVAHDCIIGNNVVISCDSKLSGHVQVDDNAVVNGKTGVVQFVRIGAFAFVGGMNKVAKDVLPFAIADGYPAVMRGVNKVGLERAGFSAQQIRDIRSAYRTLVRENITLAEAIARLKSEFPDHPQVSAMVAFAAASTLGLARPRIFRNEVEV